MRIPGAFLASKYFTDTLYPMGLAAPGGSLLSVLVCIIAFLLLRTRGKLPGGWLKDSLNGGEKITD